MADRTDRSFPAVFPELLAERGLTMRQFARICQERYEWGSIGTFSQYGTAQLVPTPEALRRIAKALDLEPEFFAEYRLAMARAELDPGCVPLATALRSLESLSVTVVRVAPVRREGWFRRLWGACRG